MPRSRVEIVDILEEGRPVKQVVEQLEATGLVEYAEPDYVVSVGAMPSDPLMPFLWGLHNTAQLGGVADADIDAPETWEVTKGDPSVVVAVIDTGVDYNHEDLSQNMWRNPGETLNGIDDDGNGYVDDVFGIDAVNDDADPFDDHYHGTHVAGTIGAAHDNGRGVAGVSGQVQIMALKFINAYGWGYTSDAIECLEYATRMKTEHGVNVVLTSNSWGGGGFSQALRDAIAASGEAGMLFVAAAGNGYQTDNDLFPHYPSSYDLPNVVSVAATDRWDRLAYFSNYGATSVDLAAPGEVVLSSIPGNGYWYLSGTSMATPHVSGAAALLWALQPDSRGIGVKNVLLRSTDPLPALEGRVASEGRLNAFSAVSVCQTAEPSVGLQPGDGFSVVVGEPTAVEVAVFECTRAVLGAHVVVIPTQEQGVSGGPRRLRALDDGVAPDAVADDGVYTAAWTPSSPGGASLDVTARSGRIRLTASASGVVELVPAYRVFEAEPFAWVDATVGTHTGLVFDDAHVEIPIGFAFPFYGETHERVRISTNGYLSFGSSGWYYGNQPLPSASEPNGLVAPYWDDLNPSRGGSIFFLLEGEVGDRRLTVEWNQVPYYYASGSATFQATLFERDGSMRFQYLDVDSGTVGRDFGASATVGIEDADGEHGVQYSFDEPAISDGMALRIRLPECSDGIDNDGDGRVDFAEDRQCTSLGDDSEARRN